MEVTREVWKDHVHLIIDGQRHYCERDVTIIDDWRDTILGRINFGVTVVGPDRHVVEPS